MTRIGKLIKGIRTHIRRGIVKIPKVIDETKHYGKELQGSSFKPVQTTGKYIVKGAEQAEKVYEKGKEVWKKNPDLASRIDKQFRK